MTQARVVLVRVRNPLNIGAAARAMANFGLSDLVAVEPYGPSWRAARSAVGAEDLLRRARLSTLPKAVADCHLVLGTSSATRRELQQPLIPLPGLAEFLKERLPSGGRLALLFGSEKIGLRNEDFQYCHALLNIPTQERTPSMNLGQAVAVAAYELARAGLAWAVRDPGYAPPEVAQIEGLVSGSMEALRRVGYWQHMPDSVRAEKLRRAFLRWRLTKGDASLVNAYLRRANKA